MNIPLAADVCNSAAVSCMNYMIKRVYDYATVNVHRCVTWVHSIKESASKTLSKMDVSQSVIQYMQLYEQV